VRGRGPPERQADYYQDTEDHGGPLPCPDEPLLAEHPAVLNDNLGYVQRVSALGVYFSHLPPFLGGPDKAAPLRGTGGPAPAPGSALGPARRTPGNTRAFTAISRLIRQVC